MNDKRIQHLADAFNSIISMMLAEIRARGLRSLIHLPQMILAAIYLRRLGKQLTALFASIDLSALPLPPAAPPIQQSDQHAELAPLDETARARQRPLVPADVPTTAGRARRARHTPVAQPHSAAPNPPVHRIHALAIRRRQTRRFRAFARPSRAPVPRATLGLRLPRPRETART